jgi:cytoskeletal protein RodZ
MRKQNAQNGGGLKQRPDKTTKARELLGADAYGLMPAESNQNRAPRPSSGDDTRASGAYARASSDDDTSDGTINSLIESDGWSERKPRIGTGQAAATVEAPPPETSKVEMLSPDLVFTANDKEKDDER